MATFRKPRPEDNATTQAVSKDVIAAVLAAADAREAADGRATDRPPAPLPAEHAHDPAVFDAPTAKRLNLLTAVAPPPAATEAVPKPARVAPAAPVVAAPIPLPPPPAPPPPPPPPSARMTPATVPTPATPAPIEIVHDPFEIMAAASSATEVDATTVTARHSAAPAARVRVTRWVVAGVLAAALILVGTVAVRSVTTGSSRANASTPPPSEQVLPVVAPAPVSTVITNAGDAGH